MYPAAERGVEGLLSVGASTRQDTLATFSQHASWVRVLAPGEGILSSVPGGNPNGDFGTWRGTSMAAPLVAGTAALLRSAVPEYHPDAIEENIRDFSTRIEARDVDRRVDAAAAMQGLVRGWPGFILNPTDETAFFVRQHYLDFLNRAPDAAGLQFWSDGIAACGANAQCAEVKRIDTSAAFFLSIEFQETGYLIHRMNVASYGQMPRYAKFMPDTQMLGQGLVVGAPGWEEQLNQQARVRPHLGRASRVYEGRCFSRRKVSLPHSSTSCLRTRARAVRAGAQCAHCRTHAPTLRATRHGATRRLPRILSGPAGKESRIRVDADTSGTFGATRTRATGREHSAWLQLLARQAQPVRWRLSPRGDGEGIISAIEYRQRFGQ